MRKKKQLPKDSIDFNKIYPYKVACLLEVDHDPNKASTQIINERTRLFENLSALITEQVLNGMVEFVFYHKKTGFHAFYAADINLDNSILFKKALRENLFWHGKLHFETEIQLNSFMLLFGKDFKIIS